MNSLIKNILFYFLVLLLGFPLAQNHFTIFKETELFGSFETNPKPQNEKWINGDYQNKYEAYFNDSIGFKGVLTKAYNQIQYSLFNKTSVKDVEVGKQDYLFEGGYIRDYMGYNFIGKEKITDKLNKIKQIQEELKQEGVTLILAFAPGKASYFPEYLPERYDTSKRTISNYNFYSSQAKNLKVNHIDFNALFVQLKKQGNTNLFPKGGVHWGEYGVILSLQKLIQKIEKEDKLDLLDFTVNNVVYYDSLRKEDRDISDALNIFSTYNSYKMPSPEIVYNQDKKYDKPKILIIGDSYGYGLTNSPAFIKTFEKIEFWYYNRQIKPRRKNHSNLVSDIVVKDEVKKFDIIILLSTETNLYKFDFGFSDSFNSNLKISEEITKIIESIKNNPDWYNKIKRQAKERNQTVEETLRKNAEFIRQKEKN